MINYLTKIKRCCIDVSQQKPYNKKEFKKEWRIIMSYRDEIAAGKTALGIEFGSTRIKAVLIGEDFTPIAQGSYGWENQLENGLWTYSLEAIWKGLQESYQAMAADVKEKYDIELTKVGSIGFSAMMHGYMAFNKNDELLVPFRTWRNTNTEKAARKLTQEFQYNIPLRWSISHLYEAVLDKEPHVNEITYITTLAGYIHWKLTGRKVLGIGDASGMFPIDSKTKQYDAVMMDKFNQLTKDENLTWTLSDILPEVLVAGDAAGTLTEEGAKLLDTSGRLESGIAVCPPEGDAGTGMTATNSVAVRTGNVSAGTSVFAMVVLEEELKKLHEEIDLVTTPSGELVAMVHCNNCTSDINAWANLFKEFAQCAGISIDTNTLYTKLFEKALEGELDCGGLMGYNYFSGEPVTGFEEGRPIILRTPETRFNLANFMRMNLYTALGALKVGLDILLKEEKVKIDKMYGHGGFFKTPVVGQKVMSAAMNAPVSVMETAGEGGAWGIAVLADYMMHKADGETLDAYLQEKVFAGQEGTTVMAEPEEADGFDAFMVNYKKCLSVEKAAVEAFK